MKRGRIKPNFKKSQYSQSKNLLDGFLLVVEGESHPIRFSTKEAARQYASDNQIELAYSG